MFDWVRFFKSQGIYYVTRGPNTGPGQVSVRCPFCGSADPSQHMSISLRGAGWRCWRNPRVHSGKSRSRLIQALLNCSTEEAHRLADEALSATPEDENLVGQLAKMMGVEEPFPRPAKLEFLPEMKPLRNALGMAAPFWHYLEGRGYTNKQVQWLTETYHVRYAWRGIYRYRVVFPIYDTNDRLCAWTARSIRKHETLRYKTTPLRLPYPEYAGPLAVLPPTQLVLGLPLLLHCPNPEVLVICEGPLDAVRVSTLGRKLGVYGTCLFGLNVSDQQALLLERLTTRFNKVILLLDPDAKLLNLRISEQFTFPIQFGVLPEGVEDPGALPESEATMQLMKRWLASNSTRERMYG